MPFIKGQYKHSEETLKKLKLRKARNSPSVTEKKILSDRMTKRWKTEDKKYFIRSGKDNPAWKGGIYPENQKIRGSLEYKLWRKSVLERDNYICIWCGLSENLQADHIKPFALYPELRFAIDNGRTLCRECHNTTNSFLNRWQKQ